ncbi:MAG: DUF4363 family protein [Clostridia bacterium]|nr:DUF4363 family protein [Clostridia bacterium]
MKELSVIIVIIIVVFTTNTITQNYTNQTVKELTDKLDELVEITKNKEKDNSERMKIALEIEKIWKQKKSKLSYFIEHDEIEKVEINITSILSYLESEELVMAKTESEQAIFLLEHIKDKYELSLENIF